MRWDGRDSWLVCRLQYLHAILIIVVWFIWGLRSWSRFVSRRSRCWFDAIYNAYKNKLPSKNHDFEVMRRARVIPSVLSCIHLALSTILSVSCFVHQLQHPPKTLLLSHLHSMSPTDLFIPGVLCAKSCSNFRLPYRIATSSPASLLNDPSFVQVANFATVVKLYSAGENAWCARTHTLWLYEAMSHFPSGIGSTEWFSRSWRLIA